MESDDLDANGNDWGNLPYLVIHKIAQVDLQYFIR